MGQGVPAKRWLVMKDKPVTVYGNNVCFRRLRLRRYDDWYPRTRYPFAIWSEPLQQYVSETVYLTIREGVDRDHALHKIVSRKILGHDLFVVPDSRVLPPGGGA